MDRGRAMGGVYDSLYLYIECSGRQLATSMDVCSAGIDGMASRRTIWIGHSLRSGISVELPTNPPIYISPLSAYACDSKSRVHISPDARPLSILTLNPGCSWGPIISTRQLEFFAHYLSRGFGETIVGVRGTCPTPIEKPLYTEVSPHPYLLS